MADTKTEILRFIASIEAEARDEKSLGPLVWARRLREFVIAYVPNGSLHRDRDKASAPQVTHAELDLVTGKYKQVVGVPETPKATFRTFTLNDPINFDGKGDMVELAAEKLDAGLAEYEREMRAAKLREAQANADWTEALLAKARIVSAHELGPADSKSIEFLEPCVGTLSIPPRWFATNDKSMFINLDRIYCAQLLTDGTLQLYHGGPWIKLQPDESQRLIKLLTMLATDECHLASDQEQRSGDPLDNGLVDPT